MTAPSHLQTAQAFDRIAPGYVTRYGVGGNAVMDWMRCENLTLLEALFPPGSRLLEIGCGGGDDALSLARAGRHILATDVSPAMAHLTATRARAAGLSARVRALALPAGRLSALRPSRPFDGAYASFGVLNCEPDLPAVAAALSDLLAPGASFVCSVMARWCPFEVAWFLLRGRARTAFRRARRGWQTAPIAGAEGEEAQVAVRYFTLREVESPFAPFFTLHMAFSLPLLLPPPYLEGVYRRGATLFRVLEGWERRLRARRPWRGMGDHIVLVFRRVGESGRV